MSSARRRRPPQRSCREDSRRQHSHEDVSCEGGCRGDGGCGEVDDQEIREWAIGEGHAVASRGRIPAEIVQAFYGVQANEGQAKVRTTPAKKTAVKKAAAEKATTSKVRRTTKGRAVSSVVGP
ncbi:histone-like nucleoid-structuring protein Lsr2, partial [Streptomyces sp. NPDC058171]